MGLVILGCFYDGPVCSPDVTHDKGGAKKNLLIKDTSHKTMVAQRLKVESVILVNCWVS